MPLHCIIEKKALQWSAFFALWGGLSCGLSVASPCAPSAIDEWVTLAHIYDGDTIKLKDGRKVRLIGINTPEIGRDGRPSDALAIEARRALSHLIRRGQRIGLGYGNERHDRYRRVLAHLYLEDQRNVQELLLAQGVAAMIAVVPNVSRLDCYAATEAKARQQRLGIWALPRYQGIASTQLPRSARGFYRIVGEIVRVGESRRSIWLNLPGRVALRIDRSDLGYFSDIDFKALLGANVIARGWVYMHKGELRLQLRHAAALELLE